MRDGFGREVDYLRVSLTQRCDLNCLYCGAGCPEGEELTPEQIEILVRSFVKTGVAKVRLTGGEPLLRKDLTEIAARIKAIPGVKTLALTTNGVCLAEKAQAPRQAGIDAVNVSLDSLDEEVYRRLTGRNALGSVLRGIQAALDAGFAKVRVNAVLIRGENDTQAEKLIGFARDNPVDVRFIELMPFSEQGKNDALVVKEAELLERFPYLTPLPAKKPGESVARYYTAPGFRGKVGFISPVSEKFCARCSRVRLLSTGEVRPCLAYDTAYDLKPFLNDENRLIEAIEKAILSKPAGHAFGCDYGNIHAMNKIGG